VCRFIAYRGFESPSLRQNTVSSSIRKSQNPPKTQCLCGFFVSGRATRCIDIPIFLTVSLADKKYRQKLYTVNMPKLSPPLTDERISVLTYCCTTHHRSRTQCSHHRLVDFVHSRSQKITIRDSLRRKNMPYDNPANQCYIYASLSFGIVFEIDFVLLE
jgi:hypothetical protein